MTPAKVQSALDGWLDFAYYRNKGIKEIEISFPNNGARRVFVDMLHRSFEPRILLKKKPNCELKITLL